MNSKCPICCSYNVIAVEVRDNLRYQLCDECGHCLQLLNGIDSEAWFKQAQNNYFGGGSPLLNAEPNAFEMEALRYRFKILKKFLPQRSNVLEVGPGAGRVITWLVSRGHHVRAIEHSNVLAENLYKYHGDVIINAEFETFDFSGNKFDAFCSFHVIEHVSNPLAHLKKAYDVVTQGGYAFVATPNGSSLQQICFPSLSPNFDSAHLCVFSRESLRRLSIAAGWKVVYESTPEFSSSWARVLTKLLRRIKGEHEEGTAGKYASSNAKALKIGGKFFQVSTAPLRYAQSLARYGNDIFLVLKK